MRRHLNAYRKAAFCSGFVVPDKPSDGLEPSTPSLPWRFGGGTGGYGRALAIMFSLQVGPSPTASRAWACLRLLNLMYLSRTRGLLSVLKTHNAIRFDLGQQQS
jgi:hypothetical protein